MKLSIEISDQERAFLELLRNHGGGGPTLESVLLYVVSSVVDGMRRPGSWERPMVASMFGEDWAEELEADPEVPYRVYPRGFDPKRDR